MRQLRKVEAKQREHEREIRDSKRERQTETATHKKPLRVSRRRLTTAEVWQVLTDPNFLVVGQWHCVTPPSWPEANSFDRSQHRKRNG